MKIYTKTGDKGTTGLLGGTRVKKSHIRIESYGTLDELNSFIGHLRDHGVPEPGRAELLEVQDRLFTLGAYLASDPEKSKVKIPTFSEADIEYLEQAIDRMNDTLPEMRSFILPGGHLVASLCHICRCVCRRAERLVVQLAEESEVSPLVIAYLNRLSDYLFVLSRYIGKEFAAEEIPWKPRS